MVRLGVLRGLVGLAALVTALVMAPAPAAAHTELTATSPANGATVTTPVEEVTLTFSGAIRPDGSTVTVTGPDGQVRNDGSMTVLNTVAHQPVARLASGTYRVDWRIVAGDGHSMTGQFSFVLALPPELEPTPASTATATTEPPTGQTPGAGATDSGTRDGGTRWWLVAVPVLVVAALAGGFALLRRRRG